MLLEFELENDGAFASASAISLIASTLRDENNGRVHDVGDGGRTKALTSALILGKNGSGKSTLVAAMTFIARFVRTSANESQQGQKIAYDPNRLVVDREGEPTRYKVVFSMRGTIYEFEFSHIRERIVSERLFVADKSVRFRRMYERIWNVVTEEYDYLFGDALSGRRSVWQDSTRDNALFLSTAAQLNSDDLKPAFQWLSDYFRSTNVASGSVSSVTSRMCLDNRVFKEKVVGFLQALDINVQDIEIEEEEIDDKFMSSTFTPDFLQIMSKIVLDGAPRSKRHKVNFVKSRLDGTLIRMNLNSESTGTQALYNLAGPLFDTLEKGFCLLIDEINTSLHTVIVSFLVQLFNDDRQNCNRAQLIFTSHDVSVLSQQRLRRDQIWFIENHGCSAQIIPLSDYSPRKDEALDKGYLTGRYGGIPNVMPALMPSGGCEA